MALTVQVPTVTIVRIPPLVIVQILEVDEVKVTAKPLVEVAVKVFALPNTLLPGLLKVMVWVFKLVVMPVEGEEVKVPLPN